MTVKKFVVITPSSDKDFNIHLLYQSEVVSTYVYTLDITLLPYKENYNADLAEWVEKCEVGEYFYIRGKGIGDCIHTMIFRVCDRYDR